MSDRGIDAKVGESANKSTATDLTQAMAIEAETPEQYRHRVARVLDRSFVVDRMSVETPDDVWGEWVPNNSTDIFRYETLGFKIDDKYAVNRKLNDEGTGKAIVGDVVFMTQPRWQHDILVAERTRIYHDTHLKKRQKEETNFVAQQDEIGMPSIVGSNSETVSGSQLKESIGATK